MRVPSTVGCDGLEDLSKVCETWFNVSGEELHRHVLCQFTPDGPTSGSAVTMHKEGKESNIDSKMQPP